MTTRRTLNESERIAWLRLARTESIGPSSFAALIARFGDAREALKEAPRLARRGGAAGELRIPPEAEAKAELDALAKLGGRLIASIEPEYPPENASLYAKIAKQGAVIAELALHTAPLARHFPRRNRLISGLARGVVVVEAAERSGSLITATYALEQGREVFAVPGSPLDPRARGSNRLIREGATLTETAEDVLGVLRPIFGHSFGEMTAPASSPAMPSTAERTEGIRAVVEEKLGPEPVEIDEVIRQCGVPAADVLTILLELELAGRVQRHPGNRIAWR